MKQLLLGVCVVWGSILVGAEGGQKPSEAAVQAESKEQSADADMKASLVYKEFGLSGYSLAGLCIKRVKDVAPEATFGLGYAAPDPKSQKRPLILEILYRADRDVETIEEAATLYDEEFQLMSVAAKQRKPGQVFIAFSPLNGVPAIRSIPQWRKLPLPRTP